MPSVCSAQDCDRQASGLGMCNKHYLRWRVATADSRPPPPYTEKMCTKCGIVKELCAFNKCAGTKDNLRPECKECHAKYHVERRKERPAYYRDLDLCRTYGITLQEYKDMFTKQGGVCAICHNPPIATKGRRKILFVDHSHITKKVRGLLCSKCNRALGLLGDDIAGLEAALNYLRLSEVN